MLEKVIYESKKTVISAKNLNDIQDAILANQEAIERMEASGSNQEIVEASVE